MKLKKNFIFTICFLFVAFLFSENHMQLIWQQEGEFVNSYYGYSIASIDFNGDSIDDLVVGSYKWNQSGLPGSTQQGKIYFYYGGAVFDTIPDLTIDGSQYNYFSMIGYHLVNCGDVNGDGFDDLGSIRNGYYQSDVRYYLEIYYGGTQCDTIPDFQKIIYNNDVNYIDSFYSLGDVNGDGYDDAGYAIVSSFPDNANRFFIIYGNDNPEAVYWDTIGKNSPAIRGIGNINNDSFADFLVSFKDPVTELKHNAIIYGDTIIDTTLIDTLYSQVGTWGFDSGGSYIGDFNGNDTDDFIGCWGYYGVGTYLWFSEDTQNTTPSIYLDCVTNGNKCSGWGDLNNDGISDIILGVPGWSNDQGKVYLFIGSESANGSIDLEIPAPAIVGTEFGTSVAVGDFNNDGFDDAAVGAPVDGYPIHEGKVYVYAGNDSLTETTPVNIHNEEIIPIEGLEFNAYPNPFNPIVTFEIKAEDYNNLQIQIYNVKGQKVKTIPLSFNYVQDDSIVWNAESQASGVFYCKLFNIETKMQLAVQKITLLK